MGQSRRKSDRSGQLTRVDNLATISTLKTEAKVGINTFTGTGKIPVYNLGKNRMLRGRTRSCTCRWKSKNIFIRAS